MLPLKADGHLPAETDTNQTADSESNSGSAKPYSDLAKPRKFDTAASEQACTCADRKQGDTTRNDADDDRKSPRQEQETYDGKDCADCKQQKEEPAAPQAEPPRSSGSMPSSSRTRVSRAVSLFDISWPASERACGSGTLSPDRSGLSPLSPRRATARAPQPQY